MSQRQWEQVGSATGIGFVAALLVSVFIVPSPPHIDATTSDIANYVGDHRTALLASAVVGALAGVLFILFLGHLRHVLQRSESGTEALSPIVYGAGLTTVAVGFICTLPLTVLAFASDSEVTSSSAVTRLLWDLNALGLATIMIVLALFVAATSAALINRELQSPILGWLGLPVAIVLAAAGVAGFYNSSHQAFWYGLNIVGLLAFAALILALSVEGLVSPAGEGKSDTVTAAPTAVPTT